MVRWHGAVVWYGAVVWWHGAVGTVVRCGGYRGTVRYRYGGCSSCNAYCTMVGMVNTVCARNRIKVT